MAKKPLGLDGQGIQKTMRAKNYLGDGIGQVGLNIMTGLLGVLVYFYTDKVGIAAAAAGTVMLISKVVDAFTDIGMGYLLDRTKSRWGKARPWLLWGAIPAGLAVAALFLVPAGASDSVKFGYALATNIFLSAVMFTAVVIPFGSLMFYATQSSEERGRMGITRAIFGYLGGMVIAIAYIPITNALGGDQAGWIKFGLGCALATTAALLIAFSANPERNAEPAESEAEERLPFIQSLSLLFRNKYWVMMLAVQTLSAVVFALTSAAGIYYVKWIIGDENLMALLGGIGLLPVLVGFTAVGPLSKRFGMAKTARIALVIGIVATLIRCVFPMDLWALLFVGPFVTLATIPLMAVSGPLVQNTVTYGEWKFGRRQVGMANAATSFGGKIGNGLGAALIGWVLALGGYDGAAASQTPAAVNAILATSIWIPGIFLVLCWLGLHWYDLESKFSDITKDLEERAQAVTA